MSCDDLSSYFVDFVNGDLPREEAEKVRLHLRSCAACRSELDGLGAVWHALGDVAEEEPDEALRTRFYALLDAHQEAASAPWKSWPRRLASWWPERRALQMAATAAALGLGLAAGAGLSRGGNGGELSELRAELASLNRLVSLSLLSQESASTRLQGVSYSRQAAAGDEEIVAALVGVVDGDDSIGVRLAALDVLAGFADRPGVAERLRASLLGQSSPLVQLALIDLLAELDGPETSRTFRELAARPDLAEAVQGRLAENLGPRA